jgi:hypothetical protein
MKPVTVSKRANHNHKEDHQEGKITKKIETQTSKLPSDLFLWSAVGAMSLSLLLKAKKQDHTSLLIGQLVSPLLLLGIYNKIVKVAGHDKVNNEPY